MTTEYLVPGIGESAKRYPEKIAVKSETRSVSYLELEKKSNQIANFMHGKIEATPHVIILLDRSPELIESIIGLLKSGLVFVPLNPEFPDNRIKKMIEEIHAEWVITAVKYYGKIKDILTQGENGPRFKTLLIDGTRNTYEPEDNVFNLDPGIEAGRLEFEREFSDNCYIYFTSGSTGIPKGVLGRQTGLAHFIRWEIKEFAVDEQVKVSQLTPPSFDPFLRDIFLPLLTGGTSCIPSNNTLMDIRELIRWIDENKITLIHTIPSLFKALSSEINDSNCFHHLKYILLAGELLRGRDIHRFIEIFNRRIQLVNVYGPTETTLAKLNYWIKPGDVNRNIIPVGKPIEGAQVLILDSKQRKCRIGKKGEIYIRTPFRSAGYYNDRELNEKLFIKNPFGKNPGDIIYKTGDLGCFLPNGDIELSGRTDFQVKIRGVRIETAGIENRLLMHSDVREVVVNAKEEENGDKYLCAYVVPIPGRKPSISTLKDFLSNDMPDYMIPSYFVFLDKIPLTPNGKVDRKILPEPELTQGQHYTPPGNAAEKKLVEIWASVLGRNPEHVSHLQKSVGIEENFFELGGHSLKATILRSRIFKEFNVQIPLGELFKYPSIKEMAGYINTSARDTFISIEPIEKKEYYALTPGQKRLYVLHEFEVKSTAYNMSYILTLEEKVNKDKLEEAFRKLISRHESLRTSFIIVDEKPVQIIHDNVGFEIECFEPTPPFGHPSREGISHPETDPGGIFHKKRWKIRIDALRQPISIHQIQSAFIRPFDLSKFPLLRVGLIKEEDTKYILIIDLHHIVTDGTSQAVLVRDFMTLYSGGELSPLRIRYKEYSVWQQHEEVEEALKRQEEFWLGEFKGEIPILNLPTDYHRPPVQSFAGNRIGFDIDEKVAPALNEIAQGKGVTRFMLLLAIFNIFLSKLSGREDIVVGTPIAGRRHADLEQVIGMFVNTLALRNYPSGSRTFASLLKEIKEQTLSAFENQDYPFESLVDKLELQRDLNRNPLFDVMFVFQNFLDLEGEIPGQAAGDLTTKPYPIEHRTSKFDLTLIIYERSEKLDFTFEYSTKLFKAETILRFIQYFKEIISSVIENPGQKIADIEVVTGAEKEQILYAFNDSEESYPTGKTIYHLFEEQVDRIPGHAALVFYDEYVTFRHFDEQSNRLANYLRREKGVQAGDRVAVLMDRSIELVVALMGVMKAGAAYVPMDASLPAERIRFVVDDAVIGVAVSQRKYLEKLTGLRVRCRTLHTIL
ncbi:MAG: amino acid adenylation domain-containing protein, partial [Candidatus Aminicenantes bacterium]|nr:amino acid adenylation domain-containing protein [Candidatus Aminicenantes bacterium]